MSSMRTKYAPLAPSSLLLDKRWKEHDYLLHLYRLRALRGDHSSKPTLNDIHRNSVQKTRNVQSAKPNTSAGTVYLPRSNPSGKRPQTAKFDITDVFTIPPQKQRWIKNSAGSSWVQSPVNHKISPIGQEESSKEIKSHWALPASNNSIDGQKSKPSESYNENENDTYSQGLKPRKLIQSINQKTASSLSHAHRPKSSYPFVNTFKPSHVYSKRRPITAKYDSNGHLINRKPNTILSTLRPVRSDYSVASMKKHFEKQQYIRNAILQRQIKQVQSPLKQEQDDYSDVFESEVEELSSLSSSSSSIEVISKVQSPLPSPSPEPPNRELTPLYIEPRFASMQTPTPPPMALNKRPSLPVFIPPSHIIKIVKDAEFLDSDSELSSETDKESKVQIFKKDGKPGIFKRTESGKIVKVGSIFDEHNKRKKRIQKRSFKRKKSESGVPNKSKNIIYIKYNTDDDITDEENNHQELYQNLIHKRSSIVSFKQLSDNEMPSSDELKDIDITSESEKGDNLLSSRNINENIQNDYTEIHVSNNLNQNEVPKRKVSHYSDIQGQHESINHQNDVQSRNMGIASDLKLVTSPIQQNTQIEFDAKLIQESGSDTDEFGRRRNRDRPSSSIYHSLPPLHPDLVLDDDDVNKCKVRLMRNTVNIHEGLAKNTYGDLEEVCELIIMNNNDNRRWLRKMYRDEYLQSLLVDLRKCLPASVAGIISNMMVPACEYDAMCLWDALKGMHKDPEVVIEILVTRTNEELEKIRKVYELRYNEELLDHIEDETTGVFQKMLMKLATGQREYQYEWIKEDAAREARALSALLDAGGDYLDKKIRDVFCRYPFPLLHTILTEYTKFRDRDIEVDIVKVLKGNFCRCVLAIIQFIQNPPNYFVQKIHKSHYGAVDDDRTLCRIIVSRAENDLAMIKQLFFLRFGIEMFDYIEQVCHSPIKGLVLRLIGNLFSREEKEMRISNSLPPIWAEDGNIQLDQRLTFPDIIKIILRKTKVVNKFVKILIAKRERMRLKENEEESSEDSGEENENVKDEESDTEKVAADMDSEEEERREAQEAQRQLRNGLKNMSFGENEGSGEGDFKSVFHSISFAQASRGILKKTEPEVETNENPELLVTLEDDLGKHSSSSHKTANLNGPVIDPSFIGRENRRGLKKLKPKKFRGTVKGISMNNFDALKDAQAVGKSMLQKNRNTEKILQFLASRNNAQRQLIIREFFRRYRRV